jgi:hypothetical protein
MTMKTMKTIMAILFTLTVMTSMAVIDGNPSKKYDRAFQIKIEEATLNLSLAMEMHKQLDPGFLNTFKLVYKEKIIYKNYTIWIIGTRTQWLIFFYPGGTKAARYNNLRINE